MRGAEGVGACATHEDKDLWFAYGSEWERKAEAVRICNSCPLLAPCREWAVREWPLYGGRRTEPVYVVVGGLTEKDIRRLRRGLEPLGVRPPGRPRGPESRATSAAPCANGHENPERDRQGRCRKCNVEASVRSKARRAAKAVC